MFVDNTDMYLESEFIFVQTLHSHVTAGSNSQKVLSIYQKKLLKMLFIFPNQTYHFFHGSQLLSIEWPI